MLSSTPLSPIIEHELDQALKKLRSQGRSAGSWGELVSGWRIFVSAVERGYRDSIYDYTNDLTVRDRVELVLAHLTHDARAVVEPEVVEIDARFASATRASPVPLPAGRQDDARWWWWRIPRRLERELLADLQAERVVEEGNG